MFKFLGNRSTTKADVLFAAAAALAALWKAQDTYKQYQLDQEEKENS